MEDTAATLEEAQTEIAPEAEPKKITPSNIRIPPGISAATAEKLRKGQQVLARGVRRSQKHGFDINGVRGRIDPGRVYKLWPDAFLVLYEAGYVDEHVGG